MNEDILSIQQCFGIIGRSEGLTQAIHAALQAAPFDVNVLIVGESGVGKEAFHKIIHNNSPRKFKKCVTVNCGGLPEGTIDSELFGHVKGAFTGALNDRKGYFEEADGSTIFLDEVGELPLATQARLLRVLEAGEYYRVGNSEIRKTNVRVIAATNVDLHKAIREGRFREDLYYRLSTITIHVPPLRERQDDIPLLFRKFASDIATKYKMPPISLDAEAGRRLLAYQWPGNIRQLLHIVEEMSIVEQDRLITAATLSRYLPAFDERVSVTEDAQSDAFRPGEKELLYKVIFELRKEIEEIKQHLGMGTHTTESKHTPTPPRALPPAPAAISYPAQESYEEQEVEEVKTLEEMERDAIASSLQRHHGLKKKVAEELGISERTLYRKINDYNLDNETKD
jgi:transcriptional regulator with PAS, ATPase and Fis domain